MKIASPKKDSVAVPYQFQRLCHDYCICHIKSDEKNAFMMQRYFGDGSFKIDVPH